MNTRTQNQNDHQQQHTRGLEQEQGIKVNGLEQVIQMLRHADPAFRESLIRRLSQRDPQLASNIRKLFR